MKRFVCPNKVMLRKAVLVNREDTCRIKREVICLMERDTLWRTIDVHTLHCAITLHDTFTSSIVSISTRLAIVREYHQAVVLTPVHLTGSVGRVVGHICLARVGVAHHQLASQLVIFVSGLPAVKVRNRRHLVHGIVDISQGNVLTIVLSGTSVTFVSSIGTPSRLPMV